MTDAHGTIPLPPSARVWYDPGLSTSVPQQPETTPIAKFESPPNDECPNGALLGVNDNFVVYAVKNGLVRVLDRLKNLRTLLRGHETKVSDVSFFQNGDILGTIGGNLIIWRIFTRESELTSEKVLEIPSELPNILRMVWHPFNTNQFWVIHDTSTDQRVATLVESTRIKTVPHEEESHPVCQLEGDDVLLEGALQLQTESSVGHDSINDLCWSGRDPRHVLTAHDDGAIRLWDVKQAGDFVGNNTSPRLCLATIHEEEAVSRCFFLSYDTANEGENSTITTPFVTATHNNARITLWSPFGEGGGRPLKMSVFGMENPSPGGYNLSRCSAGISLRDGPPAEFLLLSDRSEGNLFSLALKSRWSSNEPKRPILEGWDYVVPFGIMHPIYSWCILPLPAQDLDEDYEEEAARTGPFFDMYLYSVQSRAVQILTLTHAMCVPPEATWDESNPPVGIRVEPLDQAPISTVDVTSTDNAFEEEYDLEDETQFEEHSDDGNQEEIDEVPDDLVAPTDNGNPFANWLGAIASKASSPPPQPISQKDKLPPPPPPPTPDLAGKPVTPALAATPPIPVPDDTLEQQEPAFLSPLELLQASQNVSELEDAAISLPKNPETNKGDKKKKKSRSRSPKQQKPGKTNGGKKNPPMPVPTSGGKIEILKREANASPTVQASSLKDTAAPASSDMEEVLKRLLSIHFKKQETLVTNEIQRTVRAEIQSTMLPALSKTVTQTMEQSVVKPLQTAIAKASKESTKVRTEEVVGEVSRSVEAPVKEAFQTSMNTTLIPAYEAATREMFSQISSILEHGLSSKKDENSSKAIVEISAKLDSMAVTLQTLSAEVSQLRSQASVSTGGTVTPGGGAMQRPAVDSMQAVRNEILTLLSQRSYEAAFTKAVSTTKAKDLAVFCCKNAPLSDVLDGNTPALSQAILLCLMQQLGASLLHSQAADLKTELEWLQEIALVLDPTDENIKRHVGGVLQHLVANINAKMSQGDPALRRPLQMLLQVIRGMQ